MALYTALGYTSHGLKGAFALASFNLDYTPTNSDLPVFLYHGGNDMVIPWEFSESTYEGITRKELYLETGMQHVVSDLMVAALRSWIHRVMQPRSFL
jgi:predicted esterase